MALPTKEKTWQHQVNITFGGTGTSSTDNSSLVLAIKNALKAFSSNPWIVWGSRSWNGASGSLDGSGGGNDYWSTIADLTFAASGSNHSWIVLRQAGLGTKTAICIDCTYASYGNSGITLVFSPAAGFGVANGGTDGTGTARPTATDQIILGTDANYGGWVSASGVSRGLHLMQSSDGECTRVVVCRDNLAQALWLFDKVKNPTAAWTAPVLASFRGLNGSAVPVYSSFNDLSTYTFGRIGSASCNFYMTSEGYGSAMLGEQFTYPDDDTNEWPMCPMGLASTTASHRGARKGEVYDLWWGSTAVRTGALYPEDTSKQFAQFGDMIFPWNGSSLPLLG